jgi:hypothetical protein
MKKHTIAQQNDSAFGILGRSQKFSAIGLEAQGDLQQNNHGLGFNL